MIKPWRLKIIGDVKHQIDLCTSCGFAFVNPRPSMSFLKDYYSLVGLGQSIDDHISIESVKEKENGDPNSTLDAKRMIMTILELAQKDQKKNILDIGCGYGFFSKEALDNGFNVSPLEIATTERSIANELLGLEPVEISFEDFDCQPSTFSAVLMSQTLEHAQDINLYISKAHDLLVRDGILAIALPNFGSISRLLLQQNEPFICPPAHLNFFNPCSLSSLLKRHGFKVERIQWVSRIPKKTLEKCLGDAGMPLLPVINGFCGAMGKGFDLIHLGIMINVYARKQF